MVFSAANSEERNHSNATATLNVLTAGPAVKSYIYTRMAPCSPQYLTLSIQKSVNSCSLLVPIDLSHSCVRKPKHR